MNSDDCASLGILMAMVVKHCSSRSDSVLFDQVGKCSCAPLDGRVNKRPFGVLER